MQLLKILEFWQFPFFHKDHGCGESGKWMFLDLSMLVATLGHTLWNASCWGSGERVPLWWEDPLQSAVGSCRGWGRAEFCRAGQKSALDWGLDRYHERTGPKALLLSLRMWAVMRTLSVSPGFTEITEIFVVVVQLLSHVQLYVTPWTSATRLPCPLLSPWICCNSCPLSRWCHPTISSFIVPFLSCPQSFSASGSFPMSQLFTSGGQSIGASASESVLPMNILGWFSLRLTVWSPYCSGDSRVFSNTRVWKHQFFSAHLSLWSNPHVHTWLLEKQKL